MHCVSRLLNAHTHPVIIRRLHQFHWFIRQVALARRQQNDHTVFESLPPATYVYHTKVRFSHCPINAERQAGKLFLNSFDITRQGNEPMPTRLQGGCSYHYTIIAQSSVAEPASRNAQISINKKITVLSSKQDVRRW